MHEHRTLGGTGMSVTPLALGAMMLGSYGNPDQDECVAIVRRAVEAGVNFIDTADRYSYGESEEIVGKAVPHCRDDVILATKFTIPMGQDPNARGHSRKWVMRAVEDSLRRLGTDYIDLYQAHRPDPLTDIDELLGTLGILVHQGKVRAIGSSTFPASDIVAAQWVAERRGRERFRCEQPPYSVLARGIEREVLPVCQRHGMGVVTWGPLAGGWLSGRFHPGMAQPDAPRHRNVFSRYDLGRPENQHKLQLVGQIQSLAEESGLSMVQLAIGFVLEHPAVTAVLLGPRTMGQLENLLGAADVRLDPDVLDGLDAIVAPGTNATVADGGYEPPSITDPELRRRRRAARPAVGARATGMGLPGAS